jgi:hypothetical protein
MRLSISGIPHNDRRQIEQADKQNHKKDRDIYVSPGKLIITSPDGTKYSVEVDNAGALSTTAV